MQTVLASKDPRLPAALLVDPLRNGPTTRLLQTSYGRGWDPFVDPDWSSRVRLSQLELEDAGCVVSGLSVFPRLSKPQRRAAKRHEVISHLSSLADGEERAAVLAAETALIPPAGEDAPGPAQTWFLAGLMADEAKHHAVLMHYLEHKVHRVYPPAPALAQAFSALHALHSFELNIIAGQLVLEATASALLTGMLLKIREPLLRTLLRLIMRDEARHMAFAYTITLPRRVSIAGETRDILFEAAYAGAESLLGAPVWEALDLPLRRARREAARTLRERGVLLFFTRVIGETLRRRGYDTTELERLIEGDLEKRLAAGRRRPS